MSFRSIIVTAALFGFLPQVGNAAYTRIKEQSAYETANAALRARLNLRANQFLQIQRDETLEHLLSLAVSRPTAPDFIFRATQAGDEIKGNAIVHHISSDIDSTYVVAVDRKTGSIARIRGFSDSMTEFDRLMATVGVKVSNADQAEAIAAFYWAVNPERLSQHPILNLFELKQLAERQCQTGSFNAGEARFDSWWSQNRARCEAIKFARATVTRDGVFILKWIVLSAGSPDSCGGIPLEAQLEITRSGKIENLTFKPIH